MQSKETNDVNKSTGVLPHFPQVILKWELITAIHFPFPSLVAVGAEHYLNLTYGLTVRDGEYKTHR